MRDAGRNAKDAEATACFVLLLCALCLDVVLARVKERLAF